ncbi:MAG: methionine--tRNA ligase [Firmicutes bacterium]|nr:methionine--tRNA ligase [Bacillota bacterium]
MSTGIGEFRRKEDEHMGRKGRYYISTPIYYPSDRLHIGHVYTTTVADCLARWHRFIGDDVLFLTGSDEHGQKIERIAKAQGIEPKAYVDRIVDSFKALWKRYNISYDDFVRTTEERHRRVVQEVFRRIYEKGDIYKGEYEGWYCTPCEAFWVEKKLEDGKCPDCGRPVELVKEESYFFRLSNYADRLLQHIEENPEFIQPESRRNEMISFIKSGLEDLCVSRTTFDWGIPVPMDEEHVIYVWIDALTNYLTGAGFLQDEEKFARYWPADLHLVGKEIVRFHTIIWPIILMALDLPLPKTVFGHGWLLMEHDKMSKSKGNVVDPVELADEFGVDAVRYFLLREVSFGQDGNFSRRALIDRINADLANDLGNLLHRSVAMVLRYRDGVIPQPGALTELEQDLQQLAAVTAADVNRHIDALEINAALSAIWRLIGRANKYIDEAEPWTLNKTGQTERLDTVLYHLGETLRILALLIKSFMPETGEKIWAQLGISHSIESCQLEDTAWGGLQPGTEVVKGDPIFPRIDVEKLAEAEEASSVAEAKQEAADKAAEGKAEEKFLVSIEDFAKLDLRVAEVKAAEPVPGADRLLKLTVTIGQEERQIVAGIAQHYTPEELVGKRIVVVANLKPAKLRGVLSEGMLLAASTQDSLGLVTVERGLPSGARVK